VSAEMNAEHVLLPVREDAVSLFGLPNSEEEHLPHGREGFRSQRIEVAAMTTHDSSTSLGGLPTSNVRQS